MDDAIVPYNVTEVYDLTNNPSFKEAYGVIKTITKYLTENKDGKQEKILITFVFAAHGLSY